MTARHMADRKGRYDRRFTWSREVRDDHKPGYRRIVYVLRLDTHRGRLGEMRAFHVDTGRERLAWAIRLMRREIRLAAERD